MKPKIIVVGSSNTDMIVRVDRIPGPGETLLGGKFLMAGGGKGANQAVAAARAGGDVTFVARVGDDVFGRQALKGFAADGIRPGHVGMDGQETSGVALIFVARDGENTIAVASGANARLSPALVGKAGRAIAAAKVLLVQLEVPLESVTLAASIARRNGVPVILNPAPARSLPARLLRCVSVLTPNETEAEILTGLRIRDPGDAGKAARKLAERVPSVILTLGAKGLIIASGSRPEFVPAFKVKAVDTTAAGDVFNGALAVALAEGKPLPNAARFASAAAALSVTRWGAQPSAPRRAEVEGFLAGRRPTGGRGKERK
jgi:ribokinase